MDMDKCNTIQCRRFRGERHPESERERRRETKNRKKMED